MEQERCEETTQDVLDFECKSDPPIAKKSSAFPSQSAEIVKSNDSINNLASPTPEKTIHPPRIKNRGVALPLRAVEQNEGNSTEDEAVKLPDKYKILAEFFYRIGSSVRLLSLYKKLPTFQNICTQVEVLTKRKLSYTHLAQIKYILPEAVQVEKILVRDEKNLCMKPDMKVTLLLDVIEAHPDQSPFMVLRQVFHERLLTFFTNLPEGCDIPEATLPVLISQKNQLNFQEPLPEGSCIESRPTSIELEPLSNSAHLSPSFSRRFSQKIIVPETEKTNLLAAPLPPVPLKPGNEMNQDIKNLQQKEPVFQVSESTSLKSLSELIFGPQCSVSSSDCENSPMKSVSGPHQLMIETPAQPTPQRRSVSSSDDKVISESGISSHLVAKRSLNFLSPLKGDGNASSSIPDESKQYRDNNLQTAAAKRILVVDGVTASPPLVQTVEENSSQKMSQTVLTKHQQMLASLPNLINLIHRIFQSTNCSSITKQELVHKIISEDIWIVETREVEEQLDLLEELVPDWIHKKLVSSGDLLYSVRKVSDLESIRARLVEAV
ncbi:CDT1 Geminin-binding domain-like [Macleaya cordata]|uniref:CDT1 Geminin-binding domain-like n=1 Tax=Macleaya cordata TaxID=56857 RepID=A0A200QAA2_MACCD|nr:CDT1 Geminin-binding domain-like [Macleaya cordata]